MRLCFVTSFKIFLNLGSLFCHVQVAYVLGQLQDKAASAELSNILRKTNEHPMVRHEAAEALGSIAGLICFPDFLVRFFDNRNRKENLLFGFTLFTIW